MKGEDKLANKSQSNFLSGHQNAEMERMALLLDNSLVVLLEKHIDVLRIDSFFCRNYFSKYVGPILSELKP